MEDKFNEYQEAREQYKIVKHDGSVASKKMDVFESKLDNKD